MAFDHLAAKLQTRITTDFDIPDITPNFDTQPVQAAKNITGELMGLAIVGLLFAVIVIGLLLAFAGLSTRHKTTAWVALGGCVAGIIFIASSSDFLTFVKGFNIFG